MPNEQATPYQKFRTVYQSRFTGLLLMLIAVSIPFSIRITSILIAILAGNWLLEGRFAYKFNTWKKSPLVLLFIAFFLWHMVGLLYSANMPYAMRDLEKKFALLLFPLLFSTITLPANWLRPTLKAFVAGCLAAVLYCGYQAIDAFLDAGTASIFLYEKFSDVIHIHRVYFSMHLLFACYILLYFMATKPKGLLANMPSFGLILLFSVAIFIMASRSVMVIWFLSIVVAGVGYVYHTKKIVLGLVIVGLLLSGGLATVVFVKPVQVMVLQLFNGLDGGNNAYTANGANLRVIEWKCAREIIAEHWLTGVGTGDTEDALLAKYAKHQFEWGLLYKFNAHNQYLETFIGLGILGIFLLLAGLVIPLRLAWRQRNYLYAALILLFGLCIISESMLCAQKGIVFYAFFNALLAFGPQAALGGNNSRQYGLSN